jgi:hypothetical protein
MSNRKVQVFLLLACLIAGVILWAIYTFTQSRTDEAKYHAMLLTSRSFGLAVSAEKGRFGNLVTPLHISDLGIARFDTQREALLSSGYLTNISITVSNAAGRRGQLVKQLDAATKGTDILICQLSWQSNRVAVTCRPQDEIRLRRALGE